MGHETEKDIIKVNRLEENLDLEKTEIKKIIEVASFYIEPFHQEDKAMEMLKTIMKREPDNEIAKLWLSYCYIHYSMDEVSLIQAKELLESIIVNSFTVQKGAAKMMLAETLDDLEAVTLHEQTKLLEESVLLEKNWVKNRYILGGLYKRLGKLSEAMEQLEKAFDRLLPYNDKLPNDEILFETEITGRFIDENFLKKEKERFLNE